MKEFEKLAYMFTAWFYIIYLEKLGIWKLSCGFEWSKTGAKQQSARALQICQQNIPGSGGWEACAVFTGAGEAAGRVSAWLQRSRHHGLIEYQARSSLGWLGPGNRVEGWTKAKVPSRTHRLSQNQTCSEICLSVVPWEQNSKCRAHVAHSLGGWHPQAEKGSGWPTPTLCHLPG